MNLNLHIFSSAEINRYYLCKLNNSGKKLNCVGSIEEGVVTSFCEEGASISFRIARIVNHSLLGGKLVWNLF